MVMKATSEGDLKPIIPVTNSSNRFDYMYLEDSGYESNL
jgi:hypothetical protein